MVQALDEQARRDEILNEVWAPPPGPFGWFAQVNHKAVGARFIVTAFVFFAIAGLLALVMRIQLALPGLEVLSPDAFNQLFTMHGTTMMFLFAVPVVEGFGIYLVPLMIGARDMAFPRLNAFGYWVFLLAGALLYTSLLMGTAPDGGWFAYTPLTRKEFSWGPGLDFWAISLTFLEISAVVAAVEMIVTILKQRAPGMSLSRMPLFVWAMLVTSFMIIFAMPPLMLASVMLELDRTVSTRFFDPLAAGDPLLWQHLFWFFGHPEVYIVLLPALGIISAIVPVFARKPIFGYPFIVFALVAIGYLSFGLWLHHMFATGLPVLGLSFFAAASMIIAIPSGVQLLCWTATIWGGRLVLQTPFLYVAGFFVLFVIGGLTGPMLAAVPFDLQVHDTYFVVAHFHYVLIGGVVFPLLGGVYYWLPKMTGRLLDERLGRLSFALSFVGFNVAFFTMHITGLLGMPRRVHTYLDGLGWALPNLISTVGAFILAAGLALYVVDVALSLRRGREAGPDPWGGDTLEWATASPPPQYNFRATPVVHGRHPLWDVPEHDASYESRPGDEPEVIELPPDAREGILTDPIDATPQARILFAGPSLAPFFLALALAFLFVSIMIDLALVPLGALLAFIAIAVWNWPSRDARAASAERGGRHELPFLVSGPRSTLWWGIVLAIVIEAVVLAAMVASYVYLHINNEAWPPAGAELPGLPLASAAGALLVASIAPVVLADRAVRRGGQGAVRAGLAAALALGLAFIVVAAAALAELPFRCDAHAYGSIVWLLLGGHLTAVIAVLLQAGTVGVLAKRGHFDAERLMGIEMLRLHWVAVALAWVPVFGTVYLAPRVL